MRLPALLLSFMALAMAPAHAQLFGADGLDPSFCKQPSFRQTVAYVDDTLMIDGRTEWAVKLSDKLRATLAPGEKVTVVRLSPADGSSHELWSGCWPSYPAGEIEKIKTQTFVFSRNPADRLGDQQKYFLQGLGGALTQMYTAAKRPSNQVRFSPANAPTKQLVRALASDEGRFANSKLTIRAIVYSDLAENSDLGSVFKPGAPVNYGHQLGTYLRRSVFYLFGTGEDVSDAAGFAEQARVFWTSALRSMAATVGGIGSDLNVPNSLPVRMAIFPAELTMDGQLLDGRLSLLMNDQGDLVDSWLGISRLSSVLLTGTFRCRPANPEPVCRLDANTGSGITTREPSEMLVMTGTLAKGLKGQIGVKGTKALFDIEASPAND